MALAPLATEGLDGLCSKEQLKLLDAVDSLHSQGINHYVSLPQIILCGDQSSGKSSVLQAISGVPFPVKSNLCTRFPTELILRKAANVGVKVSIVPHHSRGETEKASLSGFQETLGSFQDLPAIIESAKATMGIDDRAKSFTQDLLRIEISGPDRPHLTIVDLPGLIHVQTRYQSSTDIKLVSKIVKTYMKEPRSIILAVVSAKNDYANQVVLKHAREADPTGSRTLGVITKPDTLTPGSESENAYVTLAQNQEIEFRLGWHVLRNTDTDARIQDAAQRDVQEADFLANSAWANLSEWNRGIKSLRDRLSKVLLEQISSELTNLMDEISSKSSACQSQLDKLGRPRTNSQEQKMYLLEVSQSFQMFVQRAIDGTYNDAFFGDVMSEAGYEKRIRAVIQNLSIDFAKELGENGRYHKVVSSPEQIKASEHNVVVTRTMLLEKIAQKLERGRGRELLGTFSPLIVADLFREESVFWESIAQAHVKRAWDAAKTFLWHLISHIADPTAAAMIMEDIVEPALDEILGNLRKKTSDLLKPHQTGHPITYGNTFQKTVQRIRDERRSDRYRALIAKHFGITCTENSSFLSKDVHFGNFLRGLMEQTEPRGDHWAASEALDFLDAYYEIAMKRLVDDIAVQVLENYLIADFNRLLSPLTVAMMADDDLQRIAGETVESGKLRSDLEGTLEVLKNGIKTCNEYARFRAAGEFILHSSPSPPPISPLWIQKGSPRPSPTLANVRRQAKLDARLTYENYWYKNRPHSYRRWDLFPRTGPELSLPRGILHRLLAERSGHGDFQEYHDLFNHNTIRTCQCGSPLNPGHFVECRNNRDQLPEPPEDTLILEYLLGPRGTSKFMTFIKATRPYEQEDNN
ncbi:Interferon-induced GTP-binding Mx2-like protein [Cladobotryum mycophilum]|uniref:Interferon-induced GTP-binding Mx2-like protein n=1 Tax=Cladobotryum mycophilum TaxID=491253 RepID=A0ABR0T3D8_9HYPO